jgi:type I restriction enzyme S subunit
VVISPPIGKEWTLAENETLGEWALPDGWVWTTVGEACEVILGQSPPSSTYNTDGIGLPFYQGKAEFGDMYPTPVKWCSEPKKIAEASDILISVRAPVGPTNLCREKSCIGRGLSAIRPRAGMSNLYFFYSLRGIEQDWQRKATGTTFSAISGKVLREQEVPLAPLPEQRRIVAEIETQFTRLDAAVAALERAQANLRRYKAAVLKAACEGRLVPTEAELARAEGRAHEPADRLLARILAERRVRWEAEPPSKRYKEPAPPDVEELPALSGVEGPELPEGWGWAALDQLTWHITSGSRGWAKYYSDQGSIFVRAQDIKTDDLVLDDVAHVDLPGSVEGTRTKVCENDLLITITGANVTKTALVRHQLDDAYVSQHVGLVRPVIGKTGQYLYYWIVSPANGRRILEKDAYGAGKPGLNLTNLRELIVAFPPLPEQRRIVAEVERRLSVVAALEASVAAALARARRLRQAVLKQAFEGRLVEQDPEDEPASVLLERIRAEKARREAEGKASRKKQRKTEKAQQLRML